MKRGAQNVGGLGGLLGEAKGQRRALSLAWGGWGGGGGSALAARGLHSGGCLGGVVEALRG